MKDEDLPLKFVVTLIQNSAILTEPSEGSTFANGLQLREFLSRTQGAHVAAASRPFGLEQSGDSRFFVF